MTSIASYHDKSEWRRARQSGLGGSDASAIANLNPWRTPLDVYQEKTSELLFETPTWRMDWGNMAESIAADLYAEKTGRQIRRQPMRRHPEHDFMIGNVDRQILAGSGDVTTTGCLEIKCPGLGAYAKMKARGLPDYVVLQLQHYLGTLAYSWGSFAIFNPEDGPPIHFDMEADQDLIAQLFEREIKFWTEYVIPRIPPPIESTSKALDVPEIEGELTIVSDEDWQRMASDLRDARELKQAAEALEETAKIQIQERMHRDELHAVEVDGIARFYYRYQAGRTNWKETAEAIARAADLKVDGFLVKGDGFTRFTPYFLRPEEDPNG